MRLTCKDCEYCDGVVRVRGCVPRLDKLAEDCALFAPTPRAGKRLWEENQELRRIVGRAMLAHLEDKAAEPTGLALCLPGID